MEFYKRKMNSVKENKLSGEADYATEKSKKAIAAK
jgi:hypothetical protein